MGLLEGNADPLRCEKRQTRRRLLPAVAETELADPESLPVDNSAKLITCHLQYGETYLPELEYESDDLIRIRRDQLDVANYFPLYPVIYFDFRVTGDSKKLVLHYRLNEATNAHDYDIFAAVLNEEGIVIQQVGNELVVV